MDCFDIRFQEYLLPFPHDELNFFKKKRPREKQCSVSRKCPQWWRHVLTIILISSSLLCPFGSFLHLDRREKENGERRDVIKGEVPKKMCLRQSDLLLLNASAYCAEEVEHFNGLGSTQCLDLNLFNNRKHLFSVTVKINISFPVS